MQIAETIIQQLGGAGRLRAMVGAYNFIAIKNGVSFRIKNQRANHIKITLNGKDLYDLEIGRIRGTTYKVVHEANDLYYDMLKPAIEKATGMYLSLFKKGGNLSYKGLPIHKEHPSGMYSFFSEKRKRFLKYDSLDEVKKHIDSEIKMAKGGRVKGNWKIEISFKKGTKYYNRMPQITYMKYGITKDDAMWYVKNLNENDEVETYSITKIPPLAEKKLKFDDLIGKTFPIEIGSYDRKKTWTKEELYNALVTVITHNLFDLDFYHSEYNDENKEYFTAFKETRQKMFADVDNVLNKYFKFTTTAYSTKEEVLVFKNKDADNRKFINDWFKNNKKISPELKRQYKLYREDYAGETPYAKGGNMQKLTEKDFIRKKKFKVGNVLVELEKRTSPIYYSAKYTNTTENEKIGSYGSPNIEDVIYDIRTSKYAKGGTTLNTYNVLFQYKGVSPRSGWVQMDNEDIVVKALSSVEAKKIATHKFKTKHPNKEFKIMGVENMSEKNNFDEMFSKGEMAKGGLLGGFNYSIGGL